MAWEVEYTDEFGEWWEDLTEDEQGDVDAYVRELERRGPMLAFPYSSDVRDRSTAPCESCGFKAAANPSESSMHSTQEEWRSC